MSLGGLARQGTPNQKQYEQAMKKSEGELAQHGERTEKLPPERHGKSGKSTMTFSVFDADLAEAAFGFWQSTAKVSDHFVDCGIAGLT